MSRSDRIDIKKKKINNKLHKWYMWRFEQFGKIKYKQLIKQLEYYEEN